MITKIAIWGIVITLAVMFLANQNWSNQLWQDVWSWIEPSPEQIQLEQRQRLETEAKNEAEQQAKIRRQTFTTRVIPLNPGQVIPVDVGDKYDFKTYTGEFSYSLLYQGHVVASGFHTPENNNDDHGDMPIDQIVFSQHPRYPYGQLTIILITNQR